MSLLHRSPPHQLSLHAITTAQHQPPDPTGTLHAQAATMNLSPATKALIRTIQRQLKNPITGTSFYPTDADLIADAVTAFHQQLKTKRLL